MNDQTIPKERHGMGTLSSPKLLLADARGTTSVEFGFICVMIVIGLISAVKGVGNENSGLWAVISSRSAEAHGTTP